LLNDVDTAVRLPAPPLFAVWDVRLNPAVIGPVAIAAAVVLAGPGLARRMSWGALLVAVAGAALAWDVSLALVDGLLEIHDPLARKTQYIHVVDDVGSSPGAFLASFTERIDDYPTHVRVHPPAFVLGLWGLEQVGLGGTWAASVVVLAIAVTAGPAALIALRELAGEDAARRAAPYLVLTVAALSIATTADAVFMAIGAWGITALVLAIVRRSDALAVVGGLLLGVALFCSYGLVLLACIPVAVAAARRRIRSLMVAAGAVALVVGAVWLAGFWWWDGFQTTRREYAESPARVRPYEFFVFNNLAATLIWLGPAVVLALTRLRCRETWLLVGGGLAAILLANLSGLSKAEVERIWLPFTLWILLATAALPLASRWPLVAQASVAIVVAVGTRNPW